MMVMKSRQRQAYGPADGADAGGDHSRTRNAGGDGGGGANTTMLGHLDTTIRSAPPEEITEAELEEAQRAEALDADLLTRVQRKNRRLPAAVSVSGMRYVVSPHSPFMRVWDQVSLLLLGIVAVLTPYEVAFMQLHVDFLFFFNRAIDLAFAFDMVLNFFLAYRNTEDGVWVRSHAKIAARYLRGWFLIDLLSVLPFDVFGVTMNNASVSQLRMLRFIRLARLVKLMRVLRVGRIFKRWESTMNVHYSVLALAKFIGWMLMLSHWLACMWELTSLVEAMTEFHDDGSVIVTWREASGIAELPPSERYLKCVYWAAMTLSTIGYGDITPVTTEERLVVTLAMLLGACLWAYIVANVCAIVTALDQHGLELKAQIDALNYFMEDKQLGPQWRPRLRQFFLNRKRLTMTLSHRKLLVHMSPALRGEVCLAMNEAWIGKVAYFKDIGEHFSTAVALQLQPQVFAPEELITGMELHIVERGVCLKDGKVFASGMVWGEDMILSNPRLRMTSPATTLTYVDVQSLSKHALTMIMKRFPARAKKVRRAALWIAMRRLLIIWAFEHRIKACTKKGGTLQGANGTVAAEDAKLRASTWDFGRRQRADTATSTGAAEEGHLVHTVNKVGKMVTRRQPQKQGSGRFIIPDDGEAPTFTPAGNGVGPSLSGGSAGSALQPTRSHGSMASLRTASGGLDGHGESKHVPNPLASGNSMRVLELRAEGHVGQSLPGTPTASTSDASDSLRTISVHGFSHANVLDGNRKLRGAALSGSFVHAARVSGSDSGSDAGSIGDARQARSADTRLSNDSINASGVVASPPMSRTGSNRSIISTDHTPSRVASLAVAVASGQSPAVSPRGQTQAARARVLSADRSEAQRLMVDSNAGDEEGEGEFDAAAQSRLQEHVEEMTNRMFDEAEIRLVLAFQQLEQRVAQMAAERSVGSHAAPAQLLSQGSARILSARSSFGRAPLQSPLTQAL